MAANHSNSCAPISNLDDERNPRPPETLVGASSGAVSRVQSKSHASPKPRRDDASLVSACIAVVAVLVAIGVAVYTAFWRGVP